jgi:predicted O-linked N-acetylglucosamine transferase (SPINDLY family)
LSHAEFYSERLALMPHCYQPNDRKRPIGAAPNRAQVGLPPSGFVFCCFNRSYKFTPAILDIWCRLVGAVPGSVLWLLQADATTQDNIVQQISRRGVAASRVIFAPKLPLAEHLGRLQLADLALDTFPVTSHTTASDALWAGVPLLTLIGETFVSRVAASAVCAAGLPELIARDRASYFTIAHDLAAHRERSHAIRAKLAKNRLTCPLFDSHEFVRNLEQLYERMWRDRCAERSEPIVLDSRDDQPFGARRPR